MAITRISQSSIKEGLEKYNSFYAGLSGPLFGNYESIQTITVGSGGAANVEFTSIPGTYQHLQVRGMGRSDYASQMRGWRIRLNGQTGSSYAYHQLYGDGSAAYAGSGASQTSIYPGNIFGANISSSIFSAIVFDILDYANTSKNTTLRAFTGADSNSVQGNVFVSSGLLNSTSAITSITVYPDLGNMAQHSTLALYGIKA